MRKSPWPHFNGLAGKGPWFAPPSAGAPGPSGPSDPYWDNVVFLSSFEGANGSTVVVNDGNGANVVARGTGQIKTATAALGASAFDVMGFGDAFEDAGTLANFGTGDFTIELFFRWGNPLMSGNFKCFLGNFSLGQTGSWGIYTDSGNRLKFEVRSQTPIQGTYQFPVGQVWHHVAVSRNGSTARMFLNGVLEGKITNAAWNFQTWGDFLIGWNNVGDGDRWDGQLDELRITKGVGRYNSDTSFDVPTEPYPRG